jgi:hypothetical protein
VLGYFVTAFAVDVFFEKASFCKYVCPVGQFGFLSAALSPLEVKVRDPGICASCQSHDCIRGNATQRGCELDLFAPAKQGNLDCTFCLDCTRACPHENVALTPAFPGLALARDPNRSGLGRLSRRPDLSALAGVIVFGAFANAAAMVAPVAGLGLVALPYGRGLAVVLGIGLAWLLCIGVGRLSAWSGELAGPPAESRRLMLFALLPLGFSMWLSHFAFHLFTAGGALRAVVSRYEVLSGMARVETGTKLVMAVGGGTRSQLDFELVVLGGGLLLCLAWLWRVASARAVRPIGYVLPWALVALALYGSGVWIVFQPMEMRGMS